LQDDPYLPTDVTSFFTKSVPVLNFFTGAHEDYHRPTDTADKIFAGQKIANIYDYTYALDAVKIGQPVHVVIERDGKQMTLTVTPEARK
jgi:hypothetical protein